MPLSNVVSEEQNGSLSHVQLLIEELSDGEFQQLSEYILKKHRKKDIISGIQPMLAQHLLALLYRHNVLVEQNWENFHFTQNVFQAHKEGITCISGSEDLFYTGSFDKSIKIWELPSKKLLSTLDHHSEAVQCLALGKSILVSGSWDKTIIVYALDNNYSIKHRLRGHLAGIISLTMMPDETLLFSGSVDKIIRIWNLQNGECLHRLGGIGGTVGALSLIPKNPSPSSSNNIIDHNEENVQYYLVSGSNDNSILVWDLYDDDVDNGNDTQKQKSSSSVENISIRKPRIIKRLEGHTRAITCLTWYKDTLEQQIKSFDQENSYLEDNHHNDLVHINTSKFIRSESASPGGTDISETGQLIGSAKDHNDIVWDLQCNSSRLVSVSSDGFIKVRSWQNCNDDNTNPSSSSSSNTNIYNRKRNYNFPQSYDHEKILFAPAAALVEVDCGIKCLLMTREWLICGTEDGILIALEFPPNENTYNERMENFKDCIEKLYKLYLEIVNQEEKVEKRSKAEVDELLQKIYGLEI
ncbi:3281_t:CDS:2 [Entrophospora sp. SA101]|nr:3281_t:CDS:2 [Entrophospora sp. SA101]